MLTFVRTDVNGLSQKRKQVQKACEDCRRRKKRCDHTESNRTDEVADYLSQSQPPQRSSDESGAPLRHDQRTPDVQGAPLRYDQGTLDMPGAPVSYDQRTPDEPAVPFMYAQRTSGEGMLADREGAQALSLGRNNEPIVSPHTASHDDGSPHFVGHLNPESAFLAAAATPTSPQSAIRPGEVGVWLYQRTGTSQSAGKQVPQPSPATDAFRSKLLLPYLQEQCDRLLPNESDYNQLKKIYLDEVQPIFPVIDWEALDAIEDGATTKCLLKQAICIAASYSSKSLTYRRLPGLAVNSHQEFMSFLLYAIRLTLTINDGVDNLVAVQVLALIALYTQLSNERALSTEFNARAVSCMHTAGLHVNAQPDRRDAQYLTTLFLCVWAVDRLNAAFHGRPVLMHERDFGSNLISCIEKQEPCFQLFLNDIILLDKVIHLYRPNNGSSLTSWEEDFPAFETLLSKCNATRVSSNLLATIETLYHAISILSHRPPETLQETPRNTASALRQNLSTSKVTFLVDHEFRGQLSMFPFVPYALSLSLRVTYRELRMSKAPLLQTRARRQLLATCVLLREFGTLFPAATIIAEMAEQLIREVDKVVTQWINNNNAQAEIVVQSGGLHATIPDQSNQLTTSTGRIHVAENHHDISQGPSEPIVAAGRNNQTWSFDTLDPSLLDGMPDLNVFECFDPQFDLSAMDAAFIENMDLSFPV